MCKVINTIEEKQAVLNQLKSIIERINSDTECYQEAARDEAELLDDLRQDPETNKYDIQWRSQNIDDYNNKIQALAMIKKHLEKLV